jgi:hypothetical protein
MTAALVIVESALPVHARSCFIAGPPAPGRGTRRWTRCIASSRKHRRAPSGSVSTAIPKRPYPKWFEGWTLNGPRAGSGGQSLLLPAYLVPTSCRGDSDRPEIVIPGDHRVPGRATDVTNHIGFGSSVFAGDFGGPFARHLPYCCDRAFRYFHSNRRCSAFSLKMITKWRCAGSRAEEARVAVLLPAWCFQPLAIGNESVGNELGLSSPAIRPNVSVSLQLAQLASASRWT